jgi:hypothetical protein
MQERKGKGLARFSVKFKIYHFLFIAVKIKKYLIYLTK